jgi:hypothetical protein
VKSCPGTLKTVGMHFGVCLGAKIAGRCGEAQGTTSVYASRGGGRDGRRRLAQIVNC